MSDNVGNNMTEVREKHSRQREFGPSYSGCKEGTLPNSLVMDTCISPWEVRRQVRESPCRMLDLETVTQPSGALPLGGQSFVA